MILLAAMTAFAKSPADWLLIGDGDYSAQQSSNAHHGDHSALLTGKKGANRFGTLMQTIDPRDYRGKRLRMTVWLRTEDVKRWAGGWLRVDVGADQVAFDNMQDRARRGSGPWAQHSLVVDVSDEATGIAFGALLSGPGKLWIDDLRFEVVDDTVALTDQMQKARRRSTNLDFED